MAHGLGRMDGALDDTHLVLLGLRKKSFSMLSAILVGRRMKGTDLISSS